MSNRVAWSCVVVLLAFATGCGRARLEAQPDPPDANQDPDAEVNTALIDAGGLVTCTGSECVCPTGYACEYECPGGDCVFDCEAGSNCKIDCAGAGCTLTCGAGAVCTETCAHSCIIECEGDATCSQTCGGGVHSECECNGC